MKLDREPISDQIWEAIRAEARWHRRVAELAEYLAVGNDWPRHKKAATEQERVLGVCCTYSASTAATAG